MIPGDLSEIFLEEDVARRLIPRGFNLNQTKNVILFKSKLLCVKEAKCRPWRNAGVIMGHAPWPMQRLFQGQETF